MNEVKNNVHGKAAEYLAKQGFRLFKGPMDGGLWNARCLDAYLLSNKQGDKAAYECLLTFGDQYIQFQPEDNKRLWQEIKDHADELLKAS